MAGSQGVVIGWVRREQKERPAALGAGDEIWSAPIFSELWDGAERRGGGQPAQLGPHPPRSARSQSSEKIGALQKMATPA